jgi:hypothetical protein
MKEDILHTFLIYCGNQYVEDMILSEEQTLAVDNFIDYVFDRLDDINEIVGKLKK